ncbi:MAG: sulfurtransferase TusA family protein [Thermodesulfobacteriota bacterium]
MKEILLDGKKIVVHATVDTCGLFCPLPIVRLKQELENLDVHRIIELFSDDPGILEDLPAWCSETGNRLLSLKKDKDNIYVAYVMKGRK